MKKIIIGFLILMSNLSYAQEHYFDNYNILPKGSSKNNGYTEYLMGLSSPHLKYNYVDMKKTPDAKLPKYKELDYEKILNGGLNSFLFENKYYGDLSYYSLFSWGNFSAMGKEVLGLANEVFFPNRKLLNLVYGYYAPEYKKAFTKLTVPEQSLYLSKLDVAEKFVQYVLKGKNREKYEQWLEKNKLQDDRYITEFMERRVKKGQWKIADCDYWIKKVRKDFEPLKKNPKIKANYFYEQMNLGDSLLLLLDHEGNQFFADKDFNRCNDKNYQGISIENGKLKGGSDISSIFNNPNPKNYIQLGDSIYFFEDVLYDFKNRKTIRDSLTLQDIGYFENIPMVSFYTPENENELQIIIGQFYLSRNPDFVSTIDPETNKVKSIYMIEFIKDDMGKIIAAYYKLYYDSESVELTVLLDFKKGVLKEFKGKGTIISKNDNHEFVKE